MFLSGLEYRENVNTPEHWHLERFALGPVNLLVAKNATGKSRTLNVIAVLARMISGGDIVNGTWSVSLVSDEVTSDYDLEITNGTVIREELRCGGATLYRRDESGCGAIRATGPDIELDFQIPANSLALVAKRDMKQHPFLEGIHSWAASVRHYQFGTPMGRDNFVIPIANGPKPDPRMGDHVAALFRQADRQFPNDFRATVCSYMGRIGYAIEDVDVQPLRNVVVAGPAPGLVPHGLRVKESDLPCWTEQISMSQGMFRSLSTFVHLAYAELLSRPQLILVDDIGEGLDYERSTSLIRLLVERAQKQGVQLVMSTNDRFVMNAVDLKHWCVIQRQGASCRVANYANSQSRFDEFRYTGLNNFDFFATDFLSEEGTGCEEDGSVR